MSPKRVLLVEDNVHVAEVTASMLVEHGHAVVSAGNVPQAVRILDSGESFDVVLSDLVMPGGRSGFDLAQEVRSRWPALPVLLATGYSDQAAEAMNEGFTLLSKPYEPSMLLRMIEATADPRRTTSRLGN